MTCADWRDKYSDYIAGTLPERQRVPLEAHVSSCADCARDLAAFRATVAALDALPRVQPPEDLLARISAAVDAEAALGTARPRTRWPAWSQISAFAAAACLLLGLVAVFRGDLSSMVLTAEKSASVPAAETAAPQAAQERSADLSAEAAPTQRGAAGSVAAPATGSDLGPSTTAGAAGSVRSLESQPAAPARTRSDSRRASGTAVLTRTGGRRPGLAPAPPAVVSPAGPASVNTPTIAADPPPMPATSLDAARFESEDSEFAGLAEPAGFTAASAQPTPASPSAPGGMGGMKGMPGMPGMSPGMGGMPGPLGAAGAAGPSAPRARTYAAEAPTPAATGLAAKSMIPADPDTPEGFLVTFVPPRTRQVGKTSTGAVVIQPSAEIKQARVTVKPDRDLKVINADPHGVVYSGKLRAQRRTTLGLTLQASQPGARGLRIEVASEAPEATTSLNVEIPGFAPAPAESAASPERRLPDITIEFDETLVRDALLAVGRQSGLPVKVGTEVVGPRVNARFQDVPVEAALRILCEEGEYRLDAREGGYAVSGP